MTLALDGVGGHHAAAAFTPEKDPVPIVQEAGWAPGLVWRGTENLAPTEIQSPDLLACSKSLYRLRYPGPHRYQHMWNIYNMRWYGRLLFQSCNSFWSVQETKT